jgi:hypothetical protein
VQLVNVYALNTQSLEAALNRSAKVDGSRIVGPQIRAGTVPAPLGRNYKASRVWIQRLGNQLLICVWTVRIGSVDELNIQLDGATKHGQRCFPISRRTPDALPGKAHRAKAEPMHRHFTPKQHISS